MNDPRLDYLRSVPDQVCLNWIEDAISDTIGMHPSSFALGTMAIFKETQPIEMFDLCVARLREKAVTISDKNLAEWNNERDNSPTGSAAAPQA